MAVWGVDQKWEDAACTRCRKIEMRRNNGCERALWFDVAHCFDNSTSAAQAVNVAAERQGYPQTGRQNMGVALMLQPEQISIERKKGGACTPLPGFGRMWFRLLQTLAEQGGSNPRIRALMAGSFPEGSMFQSNVDAETGVSILAMYVDEETDTTAGGTNFADLTLQIYQGQECENPISLSVVDGAGETSYSITLTLATGQLSMQSIVNGSMAGYATTYSFVRALGLW